MSKHFRPWKIGQTQLLPPAIEDFVPQGHLARFIVALVRDELDLSEITNSYTSSLGQPPFDPRLMVALLLYCYCNGIYSSRRIAKACRVRVDVMMIVALDPPDFRTISDFRKRHLKALSALFLQVLKLCEKAGLVKLGHVALDGTKIKANASKHRAMSYERMEKRAAELEAEVAKWLAAAEAADADEDKAFGATKSGDAMPKWVADKKRRAEKIRAAKAELEAEAKAAAEEKAKTEADAEAKRTAEGRKKPGKPAAPPSTEPEPKAQKNFTDPESRIMKSKDGFVQAYNAQAVVDREAQIIVAEAVTQEAGDKRQLVPMTDAVEANLGRKPEQLSADNGYCSEVNLEALDVRGIDGYVATGRARDAPIEDAVTDLVAAVADAAIGTPVEKNDVGTSDGTSRPEAAPAEAEPASAKTRVEAMREKIKAGGHESPYRFRKQLPEPVFGQIKQARGFRQFLMRGIDNVRGEWSLVCTAHNLLKLAQGRSLSAAGQQTEAG